MIRQCKFHLITQKIYYLHSPFQSLMERVNQYLKDRTESFDDYYPCRQQKENNECNLFHVYNWIQFFVSMYNDTIANNNNNNNELEEVRILSLTSMKISIYITSSLCSCQA
jgi:hypothetical protein